ncbi:Maf family protein [Thiohalorhabdus sp. Cl-TMA]|uniref:7-methyl-GTP pyrophosphatase n=1 Tax=Thiohalorhabdus methylotrophus TaxID=3242694 RepID=A0ABV4TZB3_9GAMM
MDTPPLILASTSPYRAAQLRQLELEFQAIPPGTDETPLPDEAPEAMVARLAEEKAAGVARQHPEAVVIGSDQCAAHQGRALGKPGDVETACTQLRSVSGRTVTFQTAICVRCENAGFLRTEVFPFKTVFRELSDEQIRRYVERDRPLDCAGSIRAESLGLALLVRTEGDDPSTVTGLPLIHTVRMLEAAGLSVL